MTQSEALEKIRKLLKNKGRIEAEADTASILAACLAEKHGIDIASMDRLEQERENQITHQCFGEWSFVPPEATYASLIIKRFFEVSPFERTGYYSSKMIVVGTEHHLAIARYVFDFLVGEFRRAWNRRRNKRVKKRRLFLHGCYQALFQKLFLRFDKSPDGPQLELALEVNHKARRDKYISENFGAMESTSVKPKETKSTAAAHGWRAGQDIEIRPGVNGDDREPAKRLGFETRLLIQ